MVLHGERIVSSCHATNNAKRPRLDGALPEVVSAPAPTAAPDQSGVCRAVARPALPGGWRYPAHVMLGMRSNVPATLYRLLFHALTGRSTAKRVMVASGVPAPPRDRIMALR